MSDKHCGGMAFPLAAALPGGLYTVDPGMTLRDYLAAKAMQASRSRRYQLCDDLARESYEIADAMLRERAK